MNKEEFENNFTNCLKNADLEISDDLVFTIKPIKEENKKSNSIDDVVRLWAFKDLSFADKFYNAQQVIKLLSFMSPRFFPLWVHIEKKENLVSIEFSLRFRKPSQLRYIDEGNPPFLYIKK